MHRRPIHPGEILYEEFLEPLDLCVTDLGLPTSQVIALLSERQDITPEIAHQLSIALGTTEMFWLNLQRSFDLSKPN